MRAVGETLGLGRTFAEAFLKAFEGREASPAELPARRPGADPASRRGRQLDAARRGGTRLLESRRRRGRQALRASGPLLRRSPARPGGCPPHRPRPRQAGGRLVRGRVRGARRPTTTSRTSAGDEGPAPSGRAVIVLGSGPNRIGQGIEFDYCCVHAAQALASARIRGGARQLQPRDRLDRLRHVRPALPRAADRSSASSTSARWSSRSASPSRFGGQTPLRLAPALAAAGVPLLGDPLDAIDAAEDRGAVRGCSRASSRTAVGVAAATRTEALRGRRADRLPGARAAAPRPRRPRDARRAQAGRARARRAVASSTSFLEGAIELDVDALCDGDGAWVAAILEHVEPAGVHSGDSACVVPAPSVTPALEAEIRADRHVASRAALGARGLLNLQLALATGSSACSRRTRARRGRCRSSRRRPECRSSSTPCRLLLGERLADLGLPERAVPTRAWAKEAIFPAERFPGADARGPEMRSTGEVMAGAATARGAYARALRAAGRGRRVGRIGAPLQTR